MCGSHGILEEVEKQVGRGCLVRYSSTSGRGLVLVDEVLWSRLDKDKGSLDGI